MDQQEQQNREPLEDTLPQESEPTGYVPRPLWQVWLARICLVLFIALIAMYYLNIMRG